MGDARDLRATFADGTFGSVVDKGTVDAIYLSAGDRYEDDVRRVSTSAAAALAPRGVFAVVSLTAPAYLWPLLEGPAWDGATSEARRLDAAYLYLLRKKREGSTQTKRRRR